MHFTFDDLTGRRFGRWQVTCKADKPETTKDRSAHWMCRCACGIERIVSSHGLKSGRSTSCGCYKREVTSKAVSLRCTTHGRSKTPEYSVWCKMRERCYNKKRRAYRSYGKRGIDVCARWKDNFSAFYEDMGPRPSERHSIDRIDGTKGYRPENCRWATPEEQDANRGYLYDFDGKKCNIAELSRISGIRYATLRMRLLELGWELEEAMSTPAARKGPLPRRADPRRLHDRIK